MERPPPPSRTRHGQAKAVGQKTRPGLAWARAAKTAASDSCTSETAVGEQNDDALYELKRLLAQDLLPAAAGEEGEEGAEKKQEKAEKEGQEDFSLTARMQREGAKGKGVLWRRRTALRRPGHGRGARRGTRRR